MSQRDGLEAWKVLVDGAAHKAIVAAGRVTEAIAQHRASHQPGTAEPVDADRSDADTTPEAAAVEPPPR